MTPDELEQRLRSLPSEEKLRLQKYLANNLPRKERPEEALQETFQRAFEKLSSLKDDSGFERWLWAIAVNFTKDKRKAAKRKKWRFWATQDDFEEMVGGDHPAPSARMETSEIQSLVRDALELLTGKEREVFELTYWGGLSESEVAEQLGISVADVKNRKRAGREKLRGKLGDLDA